MDTAPTRPGRAIAEPPPLHQLSSFLTCRLASPSAQNLSFMPGHAHSAHLRPACPAAHEQHACYRHAMETPGPGRNAETTIASDDIASLRSRFAAPPPGNFPVGEDADLFSFRDLAHGGVTSPGLLRHPRIADTARDSLHAVDGSLCSVDAFVILPTHVHLLFRQQINLLRGPTPEQVAAVFKTSVECRTREYLGRSARLWERQDFHRYLRTEAECSAAREFILRAPVRSGLVERPEEWEWLYVRE
ncbi:MAG: hypothetical protein KFF77_09010 [Bacteroidetes bacterium]|nr:hypothetical protein [Bacteroidota bacterium]